MATATGRKVSYKQADKFVEQQKDAGSDIRWDGWKMIFFRKHRGGFFGGGAYRNGEYGFETVVEADEKGFWNIPPRVLV